MLPASFWLGRHWLEVAALAGSVLVVMIVELLNTAVEAAIDRMVDALASGVASAAITKKIAEKEKTLERAKGKLKKLTQESVEKEMLTEKLPAVLGSVQEMDMPSIQELVIEDCDVELRLTTSRHLHELLERVDFYIGLENFPPHVRKDYRGFDPSKGTKTLKYEDYTAYALVTKFRSGAVVERSHFYSPLETVDEVS